MEQDYIRKNENGKVSILMGIYNCAPTLEEAIDSIINQTYTNWELILCDDCSTDDTYKIAESYQKQYPGKIILLKNEKNSRLAFTLNHCLENATGEFVARMDGDDISVPDRFEKQVAFLRSHPDIVLVGTAMQRFSDDGSLGAIAYCEEYPDKDTPYKKGLVFNFCDRDKAIVTPADPDIIPHISPITSLQNDDTLAAFFLKLTAVLAPFIFLELIA